ncbi:MAG: hypothetical protein GY750_12470 [Lentisphaerae bacterium]|nr:hypothetical protein [Lentisphaerota bacterium]MCP4102226.1 hypothetical protein [Lentisphaerota bacterium]
MSYKVRRARGPIEFSDAWDEGAWSCADVAKIDCFREESSEHKPDTQCKLLYDESGIYGLFNVKDKYVRCVSTEFQAGVCGDSCVEFFVWPEGGNGYLNFEFNCGGNLLVFHIWDWERREAGFGGFKALTEEDVYGMKIFTTLPSVVEPEIAEDTNWKLGFYIPFKLLRKKTGMPEGNISTQKWRANFYKCGDKTSHPHWASWKPLSTKNFHLPERFGEINFE